MMTTDRLAHPALTPDYHDRVHWAPTWQLEWMAELGWTFGSCVRHGTPFMVPAGAVPQQCDRCAEDGYQTTVPLVTSGCHG